MKTPRTKKETKKGFFSFDLELKPKAKEKLEKRTREGKDWKTTRKEPFLFLFFVRWGPICITHSYSGPKIRVQLQKLSIPMKSRFSIGLRQVTIPGFPYKGQKVKFLLFTRGSKRTQCEFRYTTRSTSVGFVAQKRQHILLEIQGAVKEGLSSL